MNTHKAPERYSEIVRLLHEFLHDDSVDIGNYTIEETRSELSKNGIIIDPVITKIKLMISKKKTDRRLEIAHEKRVAYEKILQLRDQSSTITNVKDRLVQILSDLNLKEPKMAAMYFRKLDEIDEKDMRSILNDFMILENDDDDIKP
jgi:hypothetical protein